MDTGLLPAFSGLVDAATKLPVPRFRRIATSSGALLSIALAIARSMSPSPSRSAGATETGTSPAGSGLVAGSTKFALPLFLRMVRSSDS